MTRRIHVKLVGLARGGELLAVVTLSTIKPRCIEYWVAKVTVDVDGSEISCQVTGLTDTSALTSIAHWLMDTFGAKAAGVSREAMEEMLAAA
jgi:hypothetical protein